MSLTSNKALRFDHETAQAAVKEILADTDAEPSHKLAALYGARLVMVHGGIPDCFLDVLDAEITYWEYNKDMKTDSVTEWACGNAASQA